MSRMITAVLCALAAGALSSCAPYPSRQVETAPPMYRQGGVRLLSWSGDVKGHVMLTYSPRGLMVEQGALTAVQDERQAAHSAMPQRPGRCELERQEAPGFVGIFQQPAPDNGYACKVRIVCQSDAPERFNINLWFIDHAPAR